MLAVAVAEPWARSLLMRLTWAAWRMIASRTMTEGLLTENRRLSEMLRRKKDSIWHQNKEELIETARMELGMTRPMAERETVTTLREKIRRERRQAASSSDPMMHLPKGLEGMKADELAAECLRRGLDVTPLPGERGARKTRPQMILMIREDVELRNSGSQEAAARMSQRPRPSSSPGASSIPVPETDEWHPMEDL